MTGVHIIEGKPTLSANLQAQALRRSGRYDYKVVEHDNAHCILEFFEISGGQRVSLGTSEFTLDDADRAGLLNRGGRMWEKYPRNMLFSRALTNGIGWFAPDAFDVGKVYTPDELKPDLELGSTGEVIDVGSITVERAPAQPPQRGRAAPRAPQAQRQERPAPALVQLAEVKDVQTLMMFGSQQRSVAGLPVDSRALLRVLAVETTQQIGPKYNAIEGGWEQAARAILADIELATGKPASADLQARVAALNEGDRQLYEQMIANGESPEEALNVVEVDDVGESANAADDEGAEPETAKS